MTVCNIVKRELVIIGCVCEHEALEDLNNCFFMEADSNGCAAKSTAV